MIYVVMGAMRTGTSMMMSALEKGGLELAYDSPKKPQKSKKDRYELNPGGQNYEMGMGSWVEDDLLERIDGKVVKCHRNIENILVKGQPVRIVVTRRPDPARRASMQSAGWGRLGPMDFTDRQLDRVKAAQAAGQDVEWIELNYDDVVDHPVRAFEALANAGWPIRARRAASVVDPKWRRH